MNPSIEVYYDSNRLPLPSVVGWLEELGIAAAHRTPAESPAEWRERYGCCLPWVVADGRVVLKGGFQREHLVRLAQRWYGAALLFWLRTPPPMPYEFSAAPFKSFQIWDGDRERVSEWSPVLLQNFRAGYRPIVVWNDRNVPPPESMIHSAIEALKDHDVVIIQKPHNEVPLLGIRAWHGELFHGWDTNSRPDFLSLANRATELQLDVARLSFDPRHALPVASLNQDNVEGKRS